MTRQDRANRMAFDLVGAGAEPETVVAVMTTWRFTDAEIRVAVLIAVAELTFG